MGLRPHAEPASVFPAGPPPLAGQTAWPLASRSKARDLAPKMLRWCGRRDSNPHAVRRSDLNRVRLPIPPRPRPTGQLGDGGARYKWWRRFHAPAGTAPDSRLARATPITKARSTNRGMQSAVSLVDARVAARTATLDPSFATTGQAQSNPAVPCLASFQFLILRRRSKVWKLSLSSSICSWLNRRAMITSVSRKASNSDGVSGENWRALGTI